MARIAEPAPSALHRVLTEHGKALRRLADAWTRSDADRDDLLQDINVALLEALPRFRGECPERAFVWRVAHNRCQLSARRRRPLAELPEHLEAPQLSASTLLQRQQRASALLDAVRALPDDKRIVVLLGLEGLSHQEIGDVTGATANAVGVKLHRAREELAAQLSMTTPTPTTTTTKPQRRTA